MVQWSTHVVTVRTTRDGAGRACDVVTGLGATPELALEALKANAEEAAQREGRRTAMQIDPKGEIGPNRERLRKQLQGLVPGVTGGESAQRVWQFEVVDVRLAPGPIEGKDSGWLAYGSLTWKGEPEQASTGSTEQ